MWVATISTLMMLFDLTTRTFIIIVGHIILVLVYKISFYVLVIKRIFFFLGILTGKVSSFLVVGSGNGNIKFTTVVYMSFIGR